MRWPVWRLRERGAALSVCWSEGLMFRVFHREFSPHRAYRLFAIAEYGPAAQAQLFFFTDWKGLWAVPQSKCLLVTKRTSRPLFPDEEGIRLPDPRPQSDWP